MTTPGNTCGYVGGLNVTVCDGGGGILRGDLGTSIDTKQPVWKRIVERMPATLELGITSLLLSLLIGVPLGVLSAVYRGSLFDNLVRFFAVIFRAVPIFWMALMLILVFSVVLGWLPTGGRQTVTLTQEFNLGDRIRHLILPALVLAFGGIAGFSRIMRTETLEVLHTDYMRTAQAKGLVAQQRLVRACLSQRADPADDGHGAGDRRRARRRGRRRDDLCLAGDGASDGQRRLSAGLSGGAGRRHVFCRADHHRLSCCRIFSMRWSIHGCALINGQRNWHGELMQVSTARRCRALQHGQHRSLMHRASFT